MRRGYKQTEIGLLPEDWEVVRLGDVLELLRNGLVFRQNKDKKGIPVTRIETISEEKIDSQKVGYIEGISEKEISEYRLQIGDILFSHINSIEHIGKTAIYNGEPPMLLHGMNLLLLRPKKSLVEPNYLLCQLRHLRAKGLFRNMSKKAVNQASINQLELGRVKLICPPLGEQKKIAEILSTVDKRLELLRKK
ncbi:MAG: restriction endonuclease subunit S, partial [Candidatus Bathyarchaeia archaeon]